MQIGSRSSDMRKRNENMLLVREIFSIYCILVVGRYGPYTIVTVLGVTEDFQILLKYFWLF